MQSRADFIGKRQRRIQAGYWLRKQYWFNAKIIHDDITCAIATMQGVQSRFVGNEGERRIGAHGQTIGADDAAGICIESARHINGQHGATQLIELCG